MSSKKESKRTAIAILKDEKGNFRGSVLFKETKKNGPLLLYVSVRGVKKGKYGIHIHEYGDMTDAFNEPKLRSIGGHFDDPNYPHQHGKGNDSHSHLGDLGNLKISSSPISFETMKGKYIRLRGKFSILGRSIAIHQHADDLGKGHFKDSKTSGHSGSIMLCGSIVLCDPNRYPI